MPAYSSWMKYLHARSALAGKEENELVAHTKSSLTLCRPEGSDLYSTTPSMSTALELVQFCRDVGGTLTLWNGLMPCYGVAIVSLAAAQPREPHRVSSYPLRTSNLTRKAAAIGGNVGVGPLASVSTCKGPTFAFESDICAAELHERPVDQRESGGGRQCN